MAQFIRNFGTETALMGGGYALAHLCLGKTAKRLEERGLRTAYIPGAVFHEWIPEIV